MNLLVLCPHYAPDLAPTGEVMTQIAEQLVARGHRLHVVTSLPWYVHHAIEPGWEGPHVRHEDTAWGRITRVHPFPTDKRNSPAGARVRGLHRLAGPGCSPGAGPMPCSPFRPRHPRRRGGPGQGPPVPFVFTSGRVPDVAVELCSIPIPG